MRLVLTFLFQSSILYFILRYRRDTTKYIRSFRSFVPFEANAFKSSLFIVEEQLLKRVSNKFNLIVALFLGYRSIFCLCTEFINSFYFEEDVYP